MVSPFAFLLLVSSLQANQPIILDQETVIIELTPRSPNQMGSFYEARGFPKKMLNVLKKQCYISIRIHNTGTEKIWFNLKDWHFSAAGKPIDRLHRDAWKKRWQEMGIPLNKQSTFRWTLIPESLDYLPGEQEGGNIILPFTDKEITVDAVLATGNERLGKPIRIHSEKLYCAEDAPEAAE